MPAPAPNEIAPTPVEGSGGLLLEIDGQIVPNYAATMVSFDEGAGLTVAQGADAFGVGMMLSSVNDVPLEDVRAVGNAPQVFQLYVRGDDAFVSDAAQHAADNERLACCAQIGGPVTVTTDYW